ncbi:DUF6691 family protein [Fulvivirga sediminis]|uniref:YeeE/YedE family protein n=1 Tax=Fulvivirga sediminis TaxID=2803949 RepID=A0A937FC88_9BACT|nr:DUF6691 family protein [Fulvivirga sediminis]MBL3658529.1 YeeE/YedE family protein [Fulvivirga sediminis]
MKYLKYLFLGLVFGVLLTKAQVISWYRIYEMFKFGSFHMYGVIGSAVVTGIIMLALVKRFKGKDMNGEVINVPPKDKGWKRYLFGGIVFGLGWALTGACPGPMYILIGNGLTVFIVVMLSAILGTFVYGILRDKLPH